MLGKYMPLPNDILLPSQRLDLSAAPRRNSPGHALLTPLLVTLMHGRGAAFRRRRRVMFQSVGSREGTGILCEV